MDFGSGDYTRSDHRVLDGFGHDADAVRRSDICGLRRFIKSFCVRAQNTTFALWVGAARNQT